MMGDIYMSDEKMYAEAKHYLKRTQNILEDYGNQRAIKDIRTKLSMIRVKGETKAKLVWEKMIVDEFLL